MPRELPEERAARIAAALDAILLASSDGKLRATAVVRAAAAKSHPLNREFDWNDRRAALRYRLDQARSLITGYAVRVRTSITTTDISPVFVRDPLAPRQEEGYVRIESVRDTPGAPEALAREELARIVGLLDRFDALSITGGFRQHYQDVSAAVDTLRAKYASLRAPGSGAGESAA